MVTVTGLFTNRPLLTLPVIVAIRAVEPLPGLAVNASVDVFLFFHVMVAASLSVCLPVARPWQDELVGNVSFAFITPEPPVVPAGAQVAAFADAVAVCFDGVVLRPGVITTLPF